MLKSVKIHVYLENFIIHVLTRILLFHYVYFYVDFSITTND